MKYVLMEQPVYNFNVIYYKNALESAAFYYMVCCDVLLSTDSVLQMSWCFVLNLLIKWKTCSEKQCTY